jgi:hypothetical protein
MVKNIVSFLTLRQRSGPKLVIFANVKLFRKLPQSTKSLPDSRDWGPFLFTSLPKGLEANLQPPHDAK